jgi:hypothetical protein
LRNHPPAAHQHGADRHALTFDGLTAHAFAASHPLVQAALAKGWSVNVFDNEETTLVRSQKAKDIEAAMATTSDDKLTFYSETGERIGWVWLIWGNGCDLISDHTSNATMEAFMGPLCEYAESLDG